MTVVVGVVEAGRVVLAADSLGSEDGGRAEFATPKVAALGPYLIGSAGLYHPQQVVARMRPPRSRPGDDPAGWIASALWPAMVRAMVAGGVRKSERRDQSWLLGVAGRLFAMDDGEVVEPAAEHFAIGSGAAYALGSLHASERMRSGLLGADAETRAVMAVAAACLHDPGCGGRIRLVSG